MKSYGKDLAPRGTSERKFPDRLGGVRDGKNRGNVEKNQDFVTARQGKLEKYSFCKIYLLLWQPLRGA